MVQPFYSVGIFCRTPTVFGSVSSKSKLIIFWTLNQQPRKGSPWSSTDMSHPPQTTNKRSVMRTWSNLRPTSVRLDHVPGPQRPFAITCDDLEAYQQVVQIVVIAAAVVVVLALIRQSQPVHNYQPDVLFD
ncbi:hypothetical protein BDV19DRAFT_4040 [Aspergillus venezuelensis]